MDKAQLLERLREIASRNIELSEEEDHTDADQALLDYINDAEISEAFDSIDKWYS